MKDHDLTGLVAVIGLFIVTPVALALMLASAKLGAVSVPIWIAVAVAGSVIMRGPLGEAIGNRLKGGAGPAELGDDALAELDEMRARLAELEERQDFSERLLARAKDALPVERADG